MSNSAVLDSVSDAATAAVYPIYVGEWGDGGNVVNGTYTPDPNAPAINQSMLAFLAQHGFSWTAYTLSPDVGGLDLITDWNTETPTSDYGAYVYAALALRINTTSLPDSTVGAFYDVALSASGGTGTDAFSVTNGALPSGLTLNPSTGEISGTLSTAGTFAFTISLSDSKGDVTSQAYTVTVDSPYQSQYAWGAYVYSYTVCLASMRTTPW